MIIIAKQHTRMVHEESCLQCWRLLQILLRGGVGREYIVTPQLLEEFKHEVRQLHPCQHPTLEDTIQRHTPHQSTTRMRVTPIDSHTQFTCGFCFQREAAHPRTRWHICTQITTTFAITGRLGTQTNTMTSNTHEDTQELQQLGMTIPAQTKTQRSPSKLQLRTIPRPQAQRTRSDLRQHHEAAHLRTCRSHHRSGFDTFRISFGQSI